MSRFVKAIAGVAALGFSTNALAQAPNCVTEAEASALFSYALPEVLQSVANKCSQSLPPTSFLSTKGTALAGTYRQDSTSNWPLARAAFFKIGGTKAENDDVVRALPDAALQGVVSTVIDVELTKAIKPADCPRIDSLVSALAPLPAANVSALLVQIMAMAGSSKTNDFNICPRS